jgi:hypothetical protein
MRGGGNYNDFNQLITLFEGKDDLKTEIFKLYNVDSFNKLYDAILQDTGMSQVNGNYVVNYSDKGKQMTQELKNLLN